MKLLPKLAALAAAAMLAACGGGGGDDDGPLAPSTPPPSGTPTYTPGVFPASSGLAARCAAPRSGNDPLTGQPWHDQAGTALHEKHWLRSWTHELYLWYSEVQDRDPALTAGVLDYFDLLKTTATTASGRPKDQFHYTWPTDEYRKFAGSGAEVGYGAAWMLVSALPPRKLVVAYVEPGSPAAAAGIGRGMEVLSIDGVDLVYSNTQAGVETLNRGMLPSAAGESHAFRFRERNGSTRDVTLVSATVVSDPVPVAKMLGDGVGYLLFNDHIATAELKLAAAIADLRDAGASELVLDLRYNGGGFLDIASELGYMIGGSHVTGQTFELQQFNSKHPNTNPVIGGAIEPVPFHDRSQGFSIASGQPLPTLDLARVIVLTSPDTCSASEALINGLRGAGIEVIQVGGATCGKPYGFYPTDNCGTTYFSIQFRTVNAAGFGDYADGFAPMRVVGDPRANLPGCATSDDFQHDLGDVDEALLYTALAWRLSGTCPAIAVSSGPRAHAPMAATDGSGLAIAEPEAPWRRERLHWRPGQR